MTILGVPDEEIWKAFFDLYETMDGYVSHLLKVSYFTDRQFGIEWSYFMNLFEKFNSNLFTPMKTRILSSLILCKIIEYGYKWFFQDATIIKMQKWQNSLLSKYLRIKIFLLRWWNLWFENLYYFLMSLYFTKMQTYLNNIQK